MPSDDLAAHHALDIDAIFNEGAVRRDLVGELNFVANAKRAAAARRTGPTQDKTQPSATSASRPKAARHHGITLESGTQRTKGPA